MKTFATTALILSMGLVQSAGAYLLEDGSFDLATSGTTTSNSAWVLNVNYPDGLNSSAQFQVGTVASNDPGDPPHMGVWFKSFEGTQGDGDEFANATLSQSIIAGSGGGYMLAFDARRNADFTATEWIVTLETSELGASVNLLAAAPNDGTWNTYYLPLAGVPAGETLVVSARMSLGEEALGSSFQSGFVDNFVLVPEPSSLALLGLGGLLLARRRR